MNELLTAADVAAILGVSDRRVRALAKRRNIGWQVPNTRIWLFRPYEVELLKPGKPGRPPR
jgi:hypothetical protein